MFIVTPASPSKLKLQRGATFIVPESKQNLCNLQRAPPPRAALLRPNVRCSKRTARRR